MSTATASISSCSENKKSSEPKPIKLRSACNCCFAAKVRCDGNKEGCKRCAEKRLECTYSQSMVGKVVGKRRKRPLPDSKTSDCTTGQWSVTVGPAALPSPASTSASESQSKRSCMSNDWSSLVHYDDQTPLDFSGCEEQFLNLDLCQQPEVVSNSDAAYLINSGLPTPNMSPPQMRFLAPSDLEATSPRGRPPSAEPVLFDAPCSGIDDSSKPHQQQNQPEDIETMAIKLLAHLKRFSIQERHSFSSILSLIKKTNAALKRLLRSDAVKSEYTCQLLLTNIMMQLAGFCEQLILLQAQHNEPELVSHSHLRQSENGGYVNENPSVRQFAEQSSAAKNAVYESIVLSTSIGTLLKRKPADGFQVLGRQESAHLEIENRLRNVVASLP